jgi:hypothetical protein
LIKLRKQNPGKELRADFSLSDIEEEERKYQQLRMRIKGKEVKVYKAREGQAIFEGIMGVFLLLLGIVAFWKFYPPPLHFWGVVFFISVLMPASLFYRILTVIITTPEGVEIKPPLRASRFIRWEEIESIVEKMINVPHIRVTLITSKKQKYSFYISHFGEKLYNDIKRRLKEKGITVKINKKWWYEWVG